MSGPNAWTRHAPVAVLALALAPFLLLSFWSHPQNDDYVYAVHALHDGFPRAFKFWWQIWSGRYTTTALLGISPLVYHQIILFKLAPLLTIAALFGALYMLCQTFEGAKENRRGCALLAATITALYLGYLSSIAEGLYTYAGIVCYQLGNILTIVVITLERIVLSSKIPPGESRRIFVRLLLLIAIATGTNELAALQILAYLGLRFLLNLTEQKRPNFKLLGALALSLLLTAISLSAPGNRARFDTTIEHSVLNAAQLSLTTGLQLIARWLCFTPLLPCAILFLPALSALPRFPVTFKTHPATLAALLIALVAGMCFPSFYGTLKLEPRTTQIIFFTFLVGFFAVLYSAVNWHFASTGKQIRLDPLSVALAGIWIALIAFGIESNLNEAYSDIASGRATAFSSELTERHKLVRESPEQTVEVPPLRNQPKTLFWFENAVDLKHDTDFFVFYKSFYAAYFEKQRIQLKAQ